MPADDPKLVALSRYRAALANARAGGRRADAILADPDADRLIPSLPIQDLYLAIKEVGLADAEELLAHAAPEQVQGFLDLDGWERDELAVDRARPWLEALSSEGPVQVARTIEALDPEVVALYVQKQAAVYDLSLEAPPEEPEGRLWPTPDGYYVLDIRAPGEDGKSLERLLDHLYRYDLSLGRRVIMSAKWELSADLEEWAFRFRQGRMADLGFPDPDEALGLYRLIDLKELSARRGSAGAPAEPLAGTIETPGLALPALVAEAIEPRSLLGLAIASLADDTLLERLHAGLVTLLNRALAADHVDPADLPAARRVLDDVVAYLGLGLEALQPPAGAVGDAASTLVAVPLERIFRAGYTLTASLGTLAETLYRRGRVRLGDPPALLLDGRHREVLAALRNAGARGRRPRMARALDTPPQTGARPFRSAADVRLAAASPGLAFGTLARTLAARILVGGIDLADPSALAVRPLRPPEVGALLSRLRDGRLDATDEATVGAALLGRIAARARRPPTELEAWFDAWFGDLGRRVVEIDGLYVTG